MENIEKLAERKSFFLCYRQYFHKNRLGAAMCVYVCFFLVVGGKKLLILKDLETLSKFSFTAEIISFQKILLHKSMCYGLVSILYVVYIHKSRDVTHTKLK